MRRCWLVGWMTLILLVLGWQTTQAARCLEIDAMNTFCADEVDSGRSAQFVIAEMPADTILSQRTYGRLADYANVYSQPSRSSTIIRNVGDGFLFVTIRSSFNNSAGEAWYEINQGEYVSGNDLTEVEASDFRGVVVASQPERDFGWVVQPVIPSREPAGVPDPLLSELPRFTLLEFFEAVLADDGWIWYGIGGGLWVRQTYLSVVDVSPRPEGVGPDDFWTEVDLYEQTFAAYDGDRLVYATLISSGLNRWPTREGLFQVSTRLDEFKMSGAEGRVDYYYLEDIPYIMYFDEYNGIALHGTYWHNRFGYKHSHGCVNMSILDAEWTYRWSSEAPNDLWVWVHTSDPLDHIN